MVRRDPERVALCGLFRAFQPGLALLVLPDAVVRRDLVPGPGDQTAVAPQPRSRLRRGPDLFLDGFFVAQNGTGSGLVPASVLHGDVFCPLGVVLWSR